MKAAFIRETGPASNIQYGDLPEPKVGDADVLVRVSAVAVNPIDTYIRAGMVKMPLPLPFIIGCDLAGRVEAVGNDVKNLKVGDRVWGSNQGLMGRQGSFSELASVDACWLYKTPESVSDEQAAAMALVGITAHLGLVRDAKLESGESLYIAGGSGGVGSTVIQMAKAIGARVLTSAGTPEKEKACLELGADAVVNYKSGNLEKAVREFAPDGLDVWWETTREPNLEMAIPLLARGGRMIVMAGRDAKPTLPLGAFYTKDCKLMGFAMFNASPEEQQRAADDINRWMEEGKLKANIDRVIPLSQAAEAHQLQEDNTIHKKGTLAGKIVLKP